MATNDFKSFATGSGANVMSQADYLALSALLTGFQSGKASSAQVNKAIRQGTTIAALVGQFIANANIDALDNGDIASLVTKFTNALNANLNLKTAATRDVGTTGNRIPDMTSQGVSYVTNGGVQYFSNGLIRQWGLSPAMSGSGVSADIVYPVPFPNEVHQIRTYDAGNPSPSINLAMASPTSLTGFRVWAVAAITAAGPALATWPTGRSTYWEALGR